jgi:hypothetical protein
VADLLIEKIDQSLLFGLLAIEHGNAGASFAVVQRARAAGVREWLSDGFSTLGFLPEAIAKHWYAQEGKRGGRSKMLDPTLSSEFSDIEHSFVQSRRGEFVQRPKQPSRLSRSLLRLLAGDVSPSGRDEASTHPVVAASPAREDAWGRSWAHDIALDVGLRFDRAASPDPQRLVALARASCQAGYRWLGARLAARAGVDLVDLLRDMGTGEASNGRSRAGNAALAQEASSEGAFTSSRSGGVGLSTGAGIPTHGRTGRVTETTVAINFVLEFLHNLQRTLVESERMEPRVVHEVAHCLLKSIPVETDVTESHVAEALRVAAIRMGGQRPEQDRNEEGEPRARPPTRLAG